MSHHDIECLCCCCQYGCQSAKCLVEGLGNCIGSSYQMCNDCASGNHQQSKIKNNSLKEPLITTIPIETDMNRSPTQTFNSKKKITRKTTKSTRKTNKSTRKTNKSTRKTKKSTKKSTKKTTNKSTRKTKKSTRKSTIKKKKSVINTKPYPIPLLNLNKLDKSELYKMYLKAGKAWEKLSGRNEDLGVINENDSKDKIKTYIEWYNSDKAREIWKETKEYRKK